LGGALAAAMLLFAGSFMVRAETPITIGFGMALTGGLAPNGKGALFAMQLWEKEVNAAGGLLGRQVKLIYYDDQSNPATIPGIYTKLLDVDKVDIVMSGYGTNMIAPAPDHHRTQSDIPRAVRVGGEHGVQLSEVFRVAACWRTEAEGSLRPRVPDRGDAANAKTTDTRPGWRGCRIPA